MHLRKASHSHTSMQKYTLAFVFKYREAYIGRGLGHYHSSARASQMAVCCGISVGLEAASKRVPPS
jgi:hypothetical protein